MGRPEQRQTEPTGKETAPDIAPAIAHTPRLVRAGDLVSRVGSLDPTDRVTRRALHAGLALLVLLGVGLAVAATLSSLPTVDWRWQPLPLALGTLGFTLFLFLDVELWRRLLHALGPELRYGSSVRIWFSSGLARFLPTSLLMPMLRVAMSERSEVPKRISFASVVYEITLAMAGALVVGAYSLVTAPDLQPYWERYLALVLPVTALIILQPDLFKRLSAWALGRLGREPLPVVLGGMQAITFASLYALSYLLAGISVYAIAQSVHPLTASDLVIVTGAFALGTVIGFAAFLLPGGLVARETALAVGLSAVMPTAPAIAVAVLVRIVQISIEVLVVAVALAHHRAKQPGR